jgi:hypothetical protein
VTPEGLPPVYEMLPGNTADKTTLRDLLAIIRRRFGAAERIWIMDRGIPTADIRTELRAADSGVRYLVGTPKALLTRYEAALAERPWQAVRPELRVKLLPHEGELYVLAESQARAGKERGMRRRRSKPTGNASPPRPPAPALRRTPQETRRRAGKNRPRRDESGAGRSRCGRRAHVSNGS